MGHFDMVALWKVVLWQGDNAEEGFAAGRKGIAGGVCDGREACRRGVFQKEGHCGGGHCGRVVIAGGGMRKAGIAEEGMGHCGRKSGQDLYMLLQKIQYQKNPVDS